MKKNTVMALVSGVLWMLAVSLLLSAATAALVRSGMLPMGSMPCLSWAATLLAGLLGGYQTARQAGKSRLPLALAAAGLYLLLVFVLRGLIFRSVGAQPWWIPVFTAAGASAGALAASGKTKKKRRI